MTLCSISPVTLLNPSTIGAQFGRFWCTRAAVYSRGHSEGKKRGIDNVYQGVYLPDIEAANCDSAADGMITNRILYTSRKNQVEERLNDCRFVKVNLTEKVYPCMSIEYFGRTVFPDRCFCDLGREANSFD